MRDVDEKEYGSNVGRESSLVTYYYGVSVENPMAEHLISLGTGSD